ncbi:uncharacterized protein BDZ99DRAFT_104182 [Mytilinidion resinicola]|uniref:Uncharacterized protein n=1 Tax=Mytilinidion resinicola TaxID=574789 RepID=A0A6A6YDE6_9PEZI|nr:uncharacterized protein BDZ99DRAFT_104182 [Mytilinidion resinicola]KAF2806115.1 hypothetical protein BDZ99DRAFT_104182 [Mytilinidion resinicola]
MASGVGYAVIPGAISLSPVQQAVSAVSGGVKVKRATEKYTEYEVPSICINIRDEFIKKQTDDPSLAQFLDRQPVSQLRSVNVGVFRETDNADPKKVYGAGKEEIYVTIALTGLDSGNGWYILIEKSYDRSPSQTSWNDASMKLKAGDAVVWRGDLLYRHPPGGGGTFMTLVYA